MAAYIPKSPLEILRYQLGNMGSKVGSKVVNGNPLVPDSVRHKLSSKTISGIKGGAMLAPAMVLNSDLMGQGNADSIVNNYNTKEANNFKQPILDELSQGIQNPIMLPKHIANIASDGIANAWNSSDFGKTPLGEGIGNFVGGTRQAMNAVEQYPLMAKANQAIQSGIANGLDSAGFGYTDPIQQSSPLVTKQQPITQSTPEQTTQGFTPIGGLNMGNILGETKPTDVKPDLNYSFTQDKVNPFDKVLPTQQTLIQQPQVTDDPNKQILMDKLPKGTGYVNGKLYDSTTGNTQGMFTGMNKERDASLDSYGKVDKNSDFYKRNKQAMSNLGRPDIEEQNRINKQASIDAQKKADSLSSYNLRHFR